jgi:hypothetical protein
MNKMNNIRNLLILLAVTINLAFFIFIFCSHVTFQRNAVGVMKYSAATNLGVVSGDLPVERVWFAKQPDGKYEFRAAWPFFGSLPFTFFGFGYGTTDRDLLQDCIELGSDNCRLVKS